MGVRVAGLSVSLGFPTVGSGCLVEFVQFYSYSPIGRDQGVWHGLSIGCVPVLWTLTGDVSPPLLSVANRQRESVPVCERDQSCHVSTLTEHNVEMESTPLHLQLHLLHYHLLLLLL